MASIKKEFSTFGTVLEKAQRKIKEADNEIEKMVTTRTRMMMSKLRNVEQIEPTEASEEKEEDEESDDDSEEKEEEKEEVSDVPSFRSDRRIIRLLIARSFADTCKKRSSRKR